MKVSPEIRAKISKRTKEAMNKPEIKEKLRKSILKRQNERHICPECGKPFVGISTFAGHISWHKHPHAGGRCVLIQPPSKEELTRLYWEEGKSYSELRDHFKLKSISTIQRWFKEYNILPRDQSLANSLAKINKEKWLNDDGVWKPKPSSSLAYVLGVMKGDGGYTDFMDKRGLHYCCIQLRVTEKEFARCFGRALRNIGINPRFWTDKKQERRHKNWSRVYGVYAQSLLFVQWYKSLTLSFLKEEIYPFKCDFLRGFYESEGGIYRNNTSVCIEITNSDKKLLQFVYNLIVQLNLHPTFRLVKRKRRPKDKSDMWKVGLYRRKEGYKLLRLIKPCIKGVNRLEHLYHKQHSH